MRRAIEYATWLALLAISWWALYTYSPVAPSKLDLVSVIFITLAALMSATFLYCLVVFVSVLLFGRRERVKRVVPTDLRKKKRKGRWRSTLTRFGSGLKQIILVGLNTLLAVMFLLICFALIVGFGG